MSVVLFGIVGKADMIVLTDGTTMQVHNVEVSSKWIFYTETDGEDADIKKISIDRVFGYKIGDNPMTPVDGKTDIPQAVSKSSSNDEKTGKLTPVPASNNDALIAAYNTHPSLTRVGKDPQPDKHTNLFLSLWGIEDGSVLSDDNVEIGFEKVYDKNDKNHKIIGNRIMVFNKTDDPIYIDLSSCYKIMNGGYSVPYYTNSVFKEGSGNSSGASMNMGGVAGALGIGGALGSLASGLTLGGGSSQSSEISTVEQRIITIPPHSRATLPGEKYSNGKEIIELYEPFYFHNKKWRETDMSQYAEHLTVAVDHKAQKVGDDPQATVKSLNVRKWMQTDYTPENTPKKIGRIITYSTSPDFTTYTSLPVNLYMRAAFGVTVPKINAGFKIIPFYDDKDFNGIIDKDHFIVGRGYVKD